MKKSKVFILSLSVMIVVGFTFLVTGTSFAACPNNITAYWKLDETSGSAYEDFIGDNDGAPNAAAAPTPDSDINSINGAQAFNSTTLTGIDVPANRTFDWYGSESFSIEVWVKTDGTAPASAQVVIGRDDDNTDLNWWVGIASDGRAAFTLFDQANQGEEYTVGVGTADISDGAWHHVVLVRDATVGATATIVYVDGNEEFNNSGTPIDYSSSGFGSPTAPLNIGYQIYENVPQFHFDGSIDEVALYDRALTLSEVQANNTAGVAGNDYCEGSAAPAVRVDAPFPDDTISLWPLDETSGSTYDDAFGDNDGAPNAAAAPTPDSDINSINGAQAFNSTTLTGIDVPANRTLDWYGSESFSIEVWVKTDGTAPASAQVVIGRDDDNTDLNWWVGIASDGRAAFTLFDQANQGEEYTVGVGTADISDGAWHHVVLVRDATVGATATIVYVDGNEEFNNSGTPIDYSSSGFGSPTAPLNIGYQIYENVAQFHFDGSIDEVALYDRALPLSEVQAHNTAGVAGNSVTSLRPEPVANAGPDQTVTSGDDVTLDGTGSSDSQGGTIVAYLWEETTAVPGHAQYGWTDGGRRHVHRALGNQHPSLDLPPDRDRQRWSVLH